MNSCENCKFRCPVGLNSQFDRCLKLRRHCSIAAFDCKRQYWQRAESPVTIWRRLWAMVVA